MTHIKFTQLKLLAVTGVFALLASVATAQEAVDLEDVGIVHITDIPNVGPHGVRPVTCDKLNGTCQNGSCPTGQAGCQQCKGQGCHPGVGCPLTRLGLCPFAGAGCHGCGKCGGKLSMTARRFMALIDPCSTACTHSPTHGFTPPSQRPYFRQPVSYQHNYPASWTGGTPSGYAGHRPAVYTPTDTTQLGYYYQKAPAWIPVPGMIPPAPQPTEWHYYGPRAVSYSPAEVHPTEAAPATNGDAAGEDSKVPPPPMDDSAGIDLERSAAHPGLLPIIR